MLNLFKTLKQKNYTSKNGWHILNELYTSRGNDLNRCLDSDKHIKDLNNVNMAKFEDCYNNYSDFGQNGNSYAQIDFENERTRAVIKFPLKNHQYKDTYIGWVDFKVKSNLKSEF